jgi:hypothetical protein
MPQPMFISDSDESLSLFWGEITPENGFDTVSVDAPRPGTWMNEQVGNSVLEPAVTPPAIAAPNAVCVPVTYWLCFESHTVVVDAGEPPLAQLHEYASIVKVPVAVPLEFVALIFAVTVVFAGAAVYVPIMSAVPAVRLMFANPKPETFAPGAVFTVIAVSGAPLVTAIGIVNGTFCNTPMYVLPGHTGVAANDGITNAIRLATTIVQTIATRPRTPARDTRAPLPANIFPPPKTPRLARPGGSLLKHVT